MESLDAQICQTTKRRSRREGEKWSARAILVGFFETNKIAGMTAIFSCNDS